MDTTADDARPSKLALVYSASFNTLLSPRCQPSPYSRSNTALLPYSRANARSNTALLLYFRANARSNLLFLTSNACSNPFPPLRCPLYSLFFVPMPATLPDSRCGRPTFRVVALYNLN